MMTIKTENWLGEFVSTIGTGDAILGGAIDGFASFSNVGGDVDVYYTIIDGLDKETGIGTLTGGKLVRKDIHATLVDGAYVKNGSAINLSGNAQVYGTANAHFLDYVQAVSNAEIVNTQAIAELKSLQINGHALTASFNLTAADVRAHPDSWMPSTEALNVYQKDASDIRYLKTQDAEQVAGLVMRVGGAREQQLQQSIDGLESRIDEALRRSYAEAGYNVVGTFQGGFTLVNANDVGIDETTGKGYTGLAGPVAAGTDPTSGVFVDRSGEILRHKLALNTGAGMVATADGRTVQERFDNIPAEVDAAGTAAALVSQHNSNPAAHPELSAFITAEANRAETAAEAAAATGRIYQTSAAGQSDASLVNGDYFWVVSSSDSNVLELWRKGASVATDTGKRTVSSAWFTGRGSISQFIQQDAVSPRLTNVYSTGVLRAQIYQAFRKIVIYNAPDLDSLFSVRAIWNDVDESSGSGKVRIVIERWTGSQWIYWLDSGYITLASLNASPTSTIQHLFVDTNWSSGKKVYIELDLSMIPQGSKAVLNPTPNFEPDLIIAKKCIYGYDEPEPEPEPSNIFISLENDYFSNVWVRYKEDISTLAGVWPRIGTNEPTRSQVYQCFKSARLYGFDNSSPIKLEFFWANSYQPTQNLYRIILSQWNGATWVRVYDAGGQKDALGIVDGQTYLWDLTDPIRGTRAVFEIDYSNMYENSNIVFNSGSPELIFSDTCFVTSTEADDIDDKLSVFNANKPYFTSRRKPTFAFIWDDLNGSDALVYNVFRDYGFLPSFALVGSKITGASMVNYKNWYLNGCTILAHSMTHPIMNNSSTLTDTEAEAQMAESKALIESYGIRVSGWVTPQSNLKTAWLPFIEKYFGYAFTKTTGPYDATVDPIGMSRVGLEQLNQSVADIQMIIDNAITNNELIVFYGHKLPSTYTDSDGTTSRFSEADLRSVLSYLKDKYEAGECLVLSCDEAVHQYYKTPLY